jgi:hypothetical protein
MIESQSYSKEFTKFIPYLKEIDIVSSVLLKRIEFIYTLVSDMCPDKIEDIFIDDYLKEDGTRDYEDLWFFSNLYSLEAKKFLTQIDLDITPMKQQIVYWSVQVQDFNFKESSEKSRFSLHFRVLEGGITGDLKASKRNCDYLQVIAVKYIKANQIPL